MNHTPKYLVSGAAGWLGSRLVETLASELSSAPPASIRCLVLPGENTTRLKALGAIVEIVEGDIRSPANCQKFCAGAENAILFHTAGIIHPKKISDFYAINLQGCKNLIEAAKKEKFARAVVVSSNSPLGNNPHPDHVFDETSPYHPYMNYGRSKMEMELFLKQAQIGSAMEIVIIRAPWFYGPNQPARQSQFFSMVRHGKFPILGSGNNLRSMAFLDNLCQGLILSAKSPQAAGEIFWIADKRPYSMNEIIDTVRTLLETEFNLPCSKKQLRLPGIIGDIATVVDFLLQSLGIYHQKFHVLSEMNKTIACSTQKAERVLGYDPKVDLKEGMRRSIRWCLENNIQI